MRSPNRHRSRCRAPTRPLRLGRVMTAALRGTAGATGASAPLLVSCKYLWRASDLEANPRGPVILCEFQPGRLGLKAFEIAAGNVQLSGLSWQLAAILHCLIKNNPQLQRLGLSPVRPRRPSHSTFIKQRRYRFSPFVRPITPRLRTSVS